MKDISLYIPGNSFFHRCNCRVKLLFIAVYTVIAYMFFTPSVLAFLFVTAMAFNVIAIGKKAFTHLMTKMVVIMMFFLIILHGFVNPVGVTPATMFGHTITLPFFGSYTVEGFYMGLVNWLRLSSVILIAELFVTTTSPQDMMNGFHKLGLPYNFCFMLSASLQLIPISTREANIIASAQRARGLSEKTIVDRFKGLVPMFVPLVVSSLGRMETMSMALESRAFGNTSHPTELIDSSFKKSDLAAAALAVVLLFAFAGIRVMFGSLDIVNQISSIRDVFALSFIGR